MKVVGLKQLSGSELDSVSQTGEEGMGEEGGGRRGEEGGDEEASEAQQGR